MAVVDVFDEVVVLYGSGNRSKKTYTTLGRIRYHFAETAVPL